MFDLGIEELFSCQIDREMIEMSNELVQQAKRDGSSANFSFGLNQILATQTEDQIENSDTTDQEINMFLKSNKAKNTVYKDTTFIRRLADFMTTFLVPPDRRNIWEIPPRQLDQIMSQFFMHLAQKNRGIIPT